MAQPQDWHLTRIRDLATRFLAERPGAERDRRQRMLIKACEAFADDYGLDARTLYWAAIHYAPDHEQETP